MLHPDRSRGTRSRSGSPAVVALLLMRMNSQADLADLGRLFSFVPQGLMAGATSFRIGQALVAGKLLPQAAYVQMGPRVSQEGGADVRATWAMSPAP